MAKKGGKIKQFKYKDIKNHSKDLGKLLNSAGMSKGSPIDDLKAGIKKAKDSHDQLFGCANPTGLYVAFD